MLEVVVYPTEPLAGKLVDILGRRAGVTEDVDEAAREILRQVKLRGDEAVA